MNKFIKIFLILLLALPVAVSAQVTGDQLTALGVESTLASKIAQIGNSSSTRIRAASGTAALPSYSFFSDTDTGLYSSSANTIGVAGDIAFNNTNQKIISNSTDGADNKIIYINAGGNNADSRGAQIALGGNEAAGATGVAYFQSGNVSGAYNDYDARHSAGYHAFKVAAGEQWRMNASGHLLGSGTGTIGWAVVDGTDNTACSSQCTTPAVFGFNLAAGATAPVIVGPSDATADICLCAGAS